jgi:hypothetical protein
VCPVYNSAELTLGYHSQANNPHESVIDKRMLRTNETAAMIAPQPFLQREDTKNWSPLPDYLQTSTGKMYFAEQNNVLRVMHAGCSNFQPAKCYCRRMSSLSRNTVVTAIRMLDSLMSNIGLEIRCRHIWGPTTGSMGTEHQCSPGFVAIRLSANDDDQRLTK